MVFLSLSFIIQFIIAICCLAIISVNSKDDLLLRGWQKLSDRVINETQIKYNCCGFNENAALNIGRPACPKTANKPCFEIVKDSVRRALNITGGLALTFSFINVR